MGFLNQLVKNQLSPPVSGKGPPNSTTVYPTGYIHTEDVATVRQEDECNGQNLTPGTSQTVPPSHSNFQIPSNVIDESSEYEDEEWQKGNTQTVIQAQG